MNFFDIFY